MLTISLTRIGFFISAILIELSWGVPRGIEKLTDLKRGECVDKIPTCHHFMVDYDACSPASSYFEFVKPNCMATCGLCDYDQECGNLISEENCKFFDLNYMGCNPLSSYFYYVSPNCKSYCRVCPYHGDVDFCENYVSESDCEFFKEAYDGCNPDSTYHNYVSANCRHYCGICNPLENPVCVDSLIDPNNPDRFPEDNCAALSDNCGAGGTLGVVMSDKCRLTCGTCKADRG